MSDVLIVDDEESICWGLERLLTGSGHAVRIASSAEEAFESAATAAPDAIVLDVRLPGVDGLTAMQQLARLSPGAPIVIITAFGSLDVAVTAIRNGAFDYLAKPFDLEQAAAVIDRALTSGRASRKPSRPAEILPGILGQSRAMQEVYKRIALVAPSDASVLITGESGTGKELVARSIHRHSQRAGHDFVPIHLAALSPTLVESELFGHVRGAFTGADGTRQGMLELADGATVFFDEAGDIPATVQVKLLRVLEQQEVTPVGSAQSRPTSFRVIAATNRKLHGAEGSANMRPDLYFRLAAFEIHLPPLRERVEDIPLLADYFLSRVAASGQPTATISHLAMDELCRRHWPGNVRQLRHAVEHGALLARGGQIEVEHLPPEIELGSADSPANALATAVRDWARLRLADKSQHGTLYDDFLAQVEPPLFETVLHSTFQNRAAAADMLGIHRATLRKKMQ